MRPTRDHVYLRMARILAERSTCARRQVGCILTNKRGHVLATGNNGVPSGWDHCTDTPCPGATLPTTTGLGECVAIHAEANALLQCRRTDEIHTAYCTTAPCIHCVKLLLNTSCQRIVFLEEYDHLAPMVWAKAGREWVKASC